MSRHWQPDEDRTRWTRVDDCAQSDNAGPAIRTTWPKGATAGLLLVASGCLAIAALVYKAASPRDSIDKNSSVDWNKVELPRQRD